MATITTRKTKHGIDLPAAYINIESIQIFKQVVQAEGGAPVNQHTIRAYGNVYADEKAFKDGMAPIENIERVYPMDTGRPAHAQVYAEITDEFGGVQA